MAVFSAIGAAIATSLGLTGAFVTAGAFAGLSLAGTIVAGVIAGGLGIATSRVLGLNKAPGIQQSKDPGVKVQLPPATDHRIPVFYGRVNSGGIAVDAEIKNRNNTMVYVFVIGEKTDSGTYTVNKIYRGDSTLNFSGGYGSTTSSSVISITDPNATSSTNVNGKMRCRVYAGNAQSSVNQIFPASGTKVAAQSLTTKIDSSTNYEGLVYAVFEVDFDRENGLTDSGQLTFDITNSLSEPSNVLLDYCLNSRYGAGLSSDDLDTASFDDMYDYSTEQVAYTTSLGVGATHDRWKINGMLSTYVPVKDNIDQICQSAATFFTYNPKVGKFSVIPNRAATTAEKTAAFVFDDDNIISGISTSETELYSMYNQIEAEYPEVERKDQTTIAVIDTPSGDRNTNEPDNPLQVRYNLINDKPRTHNLANIDLKQSRTSKVLEFDATYEALQVDVGDVVKVTNSKYGFNEKLFRMMRSVEKESEEGMLSVNSLLLEYDDDVYTHANVQTLSNVQLSGIPGWYTGIWGNIDYANIANIVGNVTIVDDPTGGNANIIDPPTGNVIGNVGLGNTNIVYPPYTPPGMPVINVPITIPDIPDIKKICMNLANLNVAGISLPGHFCHDHLPANNAQSFTPGETVTVPITLPPPPVVDPTIPTLPIENIYKFDLGMHFGGEGGFQTIPMNIPSIPVNYRGGASRNIIGPVQAGLQEEQTQSNTAVANAAVTPNIDVSNFEVNALVAANVVVELGGIDEGAFSSVNTMLPSGSFFVDEIYTQAFRSRRDIAYKEIDINPVTGKHTANANADVVDIVASGGQQIGSLGSIPSALTENFEYSISRARGAAIAAGLGRPAASATKTYIANTMTIAHYANTDLSNADGFRQIRVTNADKRIGKGDDYLPIIPIGSIGL